MAAPHAVGAVTCINQRAAMSQIMRIQLVTGMRMAAPHAMLAMNFTNQHAAISQVMGIQPVTAVPMLALPLQGQ